MKILILKISLDKSSSEESIDLKSKKRKKKKEKNDEIWKPVVASENELEDLDIKRARLGLRIRPKTTNPRF